MEIIRGKGGLHGAIKNVTRDDVYLIDVVSFYPSIMVNSSDFLPKCRHKERYADLLRMKMEGQSEIKLLINKCYGLNDESKRLGICTYGQNIMMSLIEHAGGELLQVNTDGIIVRRPNHDKVKVWERLYDMTCKIVHIKRIVQRDVNNYCALHDDDSIIRKGAILNHNGIEYKAVSEYLLKGTSIKDDIKVGTLLDYCIITKCDYYEIGGYHYEADYCRYVEVKHGDTLKIDDNEVSKSAAVYMGELRNYDTPIINYMYYLYNAKKILNKWEA